MLPLGFRIRNGVGLKLKPDYFNEFTIYNKDLKSSKTSKIVSH